MQTYSLVVAELLTTALAIPWLRSLIALGQLGGDPRLEGVRAPRSAKVVWNRWRRHGLA